jgi:hypothetical protein
VFKMKNIHVFNHHHYHDTLHDQIGKGIPVFSGFRQKGGGLGSILGLIGRYGIPLLQKYILPHAASAAMSTISDLTQGKPLKETLKSNTVGLLRNVARGLRSPQRGSGLNKRISKTITAVECGVLKKKKRTSLKKLPVPRRKKVSLKIKTKTKKPISKRDIFG